MKLNYYMRGLGVGIIVTALLMGIALSGKKEEMTDEQIRQRALEMGMVDGNVVLSELPENEEDGEKEGGGEDEGPSGTLSGNQKETESPKPASGDEGAEIPESGSDEGAEIPEGNRNVREDEEETSREEGGVSQDGQEIVNEIITITIDSGDGSRVVANKLLQAGLIDDAAAYDEYLCQNGYDKRLKTGRHDIPAKAGDAEIAAVITKKGY